MLFDLTCELSDSISSELSLINIGEFYDFSKNVTVFLGQIVLKRYMGLSKPSKHSDWLSKVFSSLIYKSATLVTVNPDGFS